MLAITTPVQHVQQQAGAQVRVESALLILSSNPALPMRFFAGLYTGPTCWHHSPGV
jgi:hypothetical protein